MRRYKRASVFILVVLSKECGNPREIIFTYEELDRSTMMGEMLQAGQGVTHEVGNPLA
jgi:hypothetical protein